MKLDFGNWLNTCKEDIEVVPIFADWLESHNDSAYHLTGELLRLTDGTLFVPVQGGSYWMSHEGKNAVNKVDVEPFFIGVYPVTQWQFTSIMGGTNPSAFSRTGQNKSFVKNISDKSLQWFPVETISYSHIEHYLRELNLRARKKDPGRKWQFRLPTNVEWEYACRCAPKVVDLTKLYDYRNLAYSFDYMSIFPPLEHMVPSNLSRASSIHEDIDLSSVYNCKVQCQYDFYLAKGPSMTMTGKDANYNEKIDSERHPKNRVCLDRTSEVGSYPPNELGLYDMHGNVWEIVYSNVDLIVRGGSWANEMRHCRAAFICPYYRYTPSCAMGFRIVAELLD